MEWSKVTLGGGRTLPQRRKDLYAPPLSRQWRPVADSPVEEKWSGVEVSDEEARRQVVADIPVEENWSGVEC